MIRLDMIFFDIPAPGEMKLIIRKHIAFWLFGLPESLIILPENIYGDSYKFVSSF